MSYEVTLGFGRSPAPKYDVIYFDPDKSPTIWYRLDHDNPGPDGKASVVPILEEALTGYVTKLAHTTRVYKGKDNKKLRVYFRVGRDYLIAETGFYTALARTILAQLGRLQAHHFKRPFSLTVETGDEGTVFATILNPANGRYLGYKSEEYPREEADVDALYARINETLGVEETDDA